MSADDFADSGVPALGDDGVLHFPRPAAEPYVEDTFPDSTYDADPTFGHTGDPDGDDDGGDFPGFVGRDAGDGGGHDPGPHVSAAEWDAGDAADVERELARLRLRLDPAERRDQRGTGAGAGGDRAGTFDEGARRVAKAAGANTGGDAPVAIGRLLERALEPGVNGGRPPDLSIHAIGQGIASLKSGAISIVFHAMHDEKDKAGQMHDLQGKPVRLDIYLDLD